MVMGKTLKNDNRNERQKTKKKNFMCSDEFVGRLVMFCRFVHMHLAKQFLRVIEM
jgi:hypothetical protein